VLRRRILMSRLDWRGLRGLPVEISNATGGGWHTLGPVVWREIYEKWHLAAWERPGDLVGGSCEMWRGGGARDVVEGGAGMTDRLLLDLWLVYLSCYVFN
jgi:hypothetical protein